MSSDAPEPGEEDVEQATATSDYDPDEDQDTESTNMAPEGERPIDPEQLG